MFTSSFAFTAGVIISRRDGFCVARSKGEVDGIETLLEKPGLLIASTGQKME
jgi:hypothetical protein